MSFDVKGRESDSPYIHMIWQGQVIADYSPVCPASSRWNLLFAKIKDQFEVSVEGASSQFVPKTQSEGSEFLVIRFALGVYMPYMPPVNILNNATFLPEANNQSFWLDGFSWQMPDYNNVEEFVHQLVREGVLVSDKVVDSAIQDQPQDTSTRTIRRHFSHTTGLSPKVIQQIERANQAVELLSCGTSILDTVHQLGYADQPHMTRSLKRYIGSTPAQIISPNLAG